jgi:hypothetical protein
VCCLKVYPGFSVGRDTEENSENLSQDSQQASSKLVSKCACNMPRQPTILLF